MSRVEVRLERTAYEPGDEITGSVEWDADGQPPRKVLVSLLWHTEGKGTEDIEIVDQNEVEHPSSSGGRDFSFRLPAFPWSFSGRLISLVWAIEASLEPKGDVDRADFVAAPGGQEVRL